MNTQRLWEESFIDCISLSKCGIILNSVSNFSNFSILFSDSIYKLYNI